MVVKSAIILFNETFKKHLLGSGCFLASSFSLHAGDLEIHFGICEEGSNCERCIDSFKYTLIPDFSSRRVVAIGFDKGGKAVWREYKGAKWKTRRIGVVRDFTVTMFSRIKRCFGKQFSYLLSSTWVRNLQFNE